MPTSGNGEYLYDVIEDWGKIPSGWSLGVVTGVAVDSQERVYICQQQQDPPVMVFDRDGNYLRSWGTGFIKEPHTIYIGPDDVLYLADRGDHVALKLTLDGQLLLELGNRGTPSDTGCTEDEGGCATCGRTLQPSDPDGSVSIRRLVCFRWLPQQQGPPFLGRWRFRGFLG